MSFPLTIGEHVVEDPPALAALVARDAAGPGGSVVVGQRPWEWILALVEQGALPTELAVGLAAALLQQPDAATIAEGARLASALHPSPLDELVVHALGAHDMLVLLQVDPAEPSRSVEDTLLHAAVAVAPLGAADHRAALLERLRNAGLSGLEARVLLTHGELWELRRWLPALRSEGLPSGSEELVAQRVARGDEAGRWLAGQHLADRA